MASKTLLIGWRPDSWQRHRSIVQHWLLWQLTSHWLEQTNHTSSKKEIQNKKKNVK